MNDAKELALPNPTELMRQATDVAGTCRDIVKKTAMTIGHNQYVKIEGWQSIAMAHGCILSSKDVRRDENGFTSVGYVKRISDGMIISEAEGFVGFCEKTWGDRDEYAQRAMCQTRAMSRAARSAFAHVVVLIDEKMSTTPAEEVPPGGFDNHKEKDVSPKNAEQSTVHVIPVGEEVPKEFWKYSTAEKKAATPNGCKAKKGNDGKWYMTPEEVA